MNNYNYKNRTILIVALMLLVFIISLRLDTNNIYPKGADTYGIYTLSRNIQENRYIVWNFDIFTTLGITTFSYPSGGLIFLSEISLISGLDLTSTIIFWNLIFVIICALLVYLISHEIFGTPFISIITTLIYLSTRFFVLFSTFYTSRNILHILFLTTLLLMLKKIDIKKIILLISLIIISFLTHRAAVLQFIPILSLILSHLIYNIYGNKKEYKIIFLFLGIMIFFSSVLIFGHAEIGTENRVDFIKTNIEIIDQISSILFSISMNFGILIILLPFGYWILLNKKDKDRKDIFIIVFTTISLAFAIETVYFFYMFLPLICILISYFLYKIFVLKNMYLNIITISIIIISVILPMYVTIYASESDYLIVRNRTLELIKYLDNEELKKSIICNNHLIYCDHISALSRSIKAITYMNGRTLIDKTNLNNYTLTFDRVRSYLYVKDDILDTPLFSNTYASSIINWNIDKIKMKQLINRTNLGYIIDSSNIDSKNNEPRIRSKFGNMNQIYDNGLQQVKVIN
ncbi:TPA: hypothetical protein HA235_05335 [Candidatus Woesearchaeota archaeon]|nr:hypothetical protein [Candidatus Woesearchaeota archaeon]HIH54907.1 hypothetical protein [Candidatus Woesearchaeota archaeon]HIJ14025.1 hypothetical protein [Candidatus Woesearchaeota archaeon]